jgi:hypothetical protein
MSTYTLNQVVYTYTPGPGNTASVTGFVAGITTATIPSTITPDANTYSVTSIGANAFQNNTTLASITIPSSVTSIGARAFQSATALTSITIPNSVTSVAIFGFNGCTNLISATLPTNASFTIIQDYLFNTCPKLTSLIIPNSVTSINNYAVTGCTLLASLTIGNSVTTIGTNVFQNCTSLSSVIIPSSVTNIGLGSFYGCSNLNLVTFLGTPVLPTIGASVFELIKTPSVGKYYSTVTNSSTIAPLFTSISFIDTPPYPCFLEGTQILCFENNEEVYRPIESLRKGDLVKTIYTGYMPIHMIGTTALYNPGNDYRVANRLYKCSREKYPALFEDLYITGCHSILVPSMTDDQWENTKAVNGDVFITDNHFRLIACADEKAEPYDEEGFMNIYHIALEHDNYYKNYGIYANGLLVESCSKRYLTELSNMRILGAEDCAVSEDGDKVLSRQLVETY